MKRPLSFVKSPLSLKWLTSCLLFLICANSFAQETLWEESFETDGNGSRYTPTLETFDTNHDYFTRTDGTNISTVSGPYSNINGIYFWAAEDLDDPEVGNGNAELSVTSNAFSTSGYTNLTFSGLFAAGNNNGAGANNFDSSDSLIVYYSTDEGATFIRGLKFSYQNNGDSSNEPIGLDADFDGGMDGAQLTNTFTSFSFEIPDASSIIIKVTCKVNSGSEELAFDHLKVTGTVGAGEPEAVILINEVDADQTGTDTQEFIELYDEGVGNSSLDGYVVVLFNGSDDASYQAFDLDGYSTDENGYFVIGASTVANVDLTISNNILQNGADAVALYKGKNASDFPTDTPIDLTSALVDAIVYDTNDGDDTALLTLLNSGQAQINEDANGTKDTQSIGRYSNGSGGLRNSDTWISTVPTPGEANDDGIPDPVMILNEIDADQTGTDSNEFIELYDGGVGNSPLDGYVVVFYNGSDDRSYNDAIDLDGYSTDANGYFVIGSSTVTNVDLTFSSATNNLQNGADAVALYKGKDATDFPNDTNIDTTSALVDAIVYDTDDDDDTGLLILVNTDQPQIDEAGLGNKDEHSIGRILNGAGGERNSVYWTPILPTPGAENVDTFNPEVINISPFENQDNVNIDEDISIEFSELISIDASAEIALLKNDGTGFVDVVRYQLDSSAVTVNDNDIAISLPTLEEQAVYQIELDSAAILDLSGNAIDPFSSTFFTAGTIPNISFVTDPYQSNPSLDFEQVTFATTEILTVDLVASGLINGTSPVNLSLSGDDASEFSFGVKIGGSVSYGSTYSYTPTNGQINDSIFIAFTPTKCGDLSATLVANTLNSTTVELGLTGRTIGGACDNLFSNKSSIDFGITDQSFTPVDSILLNGENLTDAFIEFKNTPDNNYQLSTDGINFSTTRINLADNVTDRKIYIKLQGSIGTFLDTLVLSDLSGTSYGNITLRGSSFDQANIADISTARAETVGTTVTVSGILTATDQFGGPAYLQDETAGIAVFWEDLHEQAEIGDSIVITGEIESYFDLVQIGGDNIYYSIYTPVSTTVTPPIINAADLGNYEGQLIQISGEFDQKTDLLYPNSNFDMTDALSTSYQLRIDNNVNLVGRTRPQSSVMVTGVVGRYQSTFQLMPRFIEDLPGTETYASENNDFPKDKTFDVVTWNMEFFGSQVDGYGPTDKDLQLANAKKLLTELDADIIAVQEVSDEQTLQQLVDLLDGYDRVCSDVWSYSFTPPDPSFPNQKLCLIYKTSTVSVTNTRVIFEEFYEAERASVDKLATYPTGSASSFWSSGRLPFAVTVDVTLRGTTESFTLINLHAKSGVDSDDIARKTFDAQALYDTIAVNYSSDANIIILGDLNDDLDISIDGSSDSPYKPFVDDTNHYSSPTLALSNEGLRSTIHFGNVIDHQIFSNEVQDMYLENSAEVFIPFNLIDDFEGTTSDHLPIITRIDFTVPTVWNGSSWSNGDPDAYTNIEIGDNAPVDEDIECLDLTIQEGYKLVLPANRTVTINGDLNNNGEGMEGAGKLLFSANGETVHINDTITITGVVEVSSGTTLATGNNIKLADGATLIHANESDITGTIQASRQGNTDPLAYNFWSVPFQENANVVNIGGDHRYTFDEPSSTWETATSSLSTGQGIIATGADSVGMEGTPYADNVQVPVTHQGTFADYKGFNLIGNPFLAPLDYTAFVTTNSNIIDGALYMYNGNPGGSGNYTTVNSSTPLDIATFQGFFVRVAADGNITFLHEHKKASQSNGFHRKAYTKIDLTIADKKYTDQTSLLVGEGFTDKQDYLYDAHKLYGDQPLSIGFAKGAQTNSILALEEKEQLTLPLKVQSATSDALISIKDKAIFEQYEVILIDHKDQTSIDLSHENALIDVVAVNENRYSLEVRKKATVLALASTTNVIDIKANTSSFELNNLISGYTEIKVTDLSGKVLFTDTFQSESSHYQGEWTLKRDQLYIISLVNNQQSLVRKIRFGL